MFAKYKMTELHQELTAIFHGLEMSLSATQNIILMTCKAASKMVLIMIKLVFFHPTLVRKRGPTEWEEVETYRAHVAHYMTPSKL